MPPYDKPELPDQSGIMFHNVKDRKLTNLGKARDYSAWPVNEKGFVQSGIYDPFARKYIHNYWWLLLFSAFVNQLFYIMQLPVCDVCRRLNFFFNFTVKFIFWYFIYLRYFFAIYMYEQGTWIFSFKVLKTWLKLIDEKKRL